MRHDTMSKVSNHRGPTRSTRPLGSVKVTSSADSIPKFPPLNVSPKREVFNGLQGSAMTVPPPKPELPREERPTPTRNRSPNKRAVGSSKSDTHSTKSDDGALEKVRAELRESMIREKDLKQQIMHLQKVIDELKQQIRDKDQIIEDLQKQFELKESEYKEKYEKECAAHRFTQAELSKCKKEVEEINKRLQTVERDCQERINDNTRKHEVAISELKAEKAREISARDEKLNKLKKQMADALQGNSWERQQQLDELTKELSKVQEEADLLRMRLKAYKNKQGGCSNCDQLSSQLSQAQKSAKDKDSKISDLQSQLKKQGKGGR